MYAIPRKGLLRDGRGRGLCKPMGREVVKMNGNVRGWMSSLEPLVKEWMNWSGVGVGFGSRSQDAGLFI
jgi:hypothetical protein